MTDSKRIDLILEELRNLWLKHPEQRFGQLLENYVFPSVVCLIGGHKGSTAYTFFQEDEVTLQRLKELGANKDE